MSDKIWVVENQLDTGKWHLWGAWKTLREAKARMKEADEYYTDHDEFSPFIWRVRKFVPAEQQKGEA